MSIQLIAVDMDDTLLDSKRSISPRAANAIRCAVQKGVKVVIATGRMYCSALPYAKQLELNVPLITYNGALIKEVLSGETLYHRPVDYQVACEVMALFRDHGWYVQTYVDDGLYVDKIIKQTEVYMKISGIKAQEVGKRLYQPWAAPTKILAMVEPDEKEYVEKILKERFQKDLFITSSKAAFIEMTHFTVNKGTGLAFLAKRLGINRKEIMAVGDSFNDIDMLEYAGLGVAMGSAPDAVKAKADAVTLRNDEDGVAEAIEKYVL